MASHSFIARVLVALSFVYAAIATTPAFDSFIYQPGNDANLTVAINVPSNSSDLYIYFSASAQYQWAGFGFGSVMDNSLLIMMYPATDGTSVTVSPRFSQNHNPVHTTSVNITTLPGSVLTVDGVMVLKAVCTNCRQWSTGSVNVASQSQSMIYAIGPQEPNFSSDNLAANLNIHSVNSQFTLNLQKATGEGGVPDPITHTNGTVISNTSDAEAHEFPIAVHAFLLISCFLFIFPGGYLFLRVFNRVWLHAGIQSLGIVFLLAGLAAGIIFNVQQKRPISYHQVIGIITSFFVLSAFTLGAISHSYFKRNKVSSPLLKFHRIAGPSSIVLGWGACISGFVFRGETGRILPFSVILLAVIIFVGGITFFMHKRKVRKDALKTPAAQNFNEGYYGQPEAPAGGPPKYGAGHGYYAGEGVPMQTFNQPYPPQQQAGYEYPPPQQQQGAYLQKQPQVTVQYTNRI